MNQLSPGNADEVAALVKEGKVGSILNITDPEQVNKIQDIAVKESRLGIPILMSRDVIHGYKTIFPIPLGQAATFNPQVAEDGARIAAVEASADGIRWTFAPMIDISRDARWGRMAESCGEDPYLSAVMGVAMVRGFRENRFVTPLPLPLVPNTLWVMVLLKLVRTITQPLFLNVCCVIYICLLSRLWLKQDAPPL